MPIDDYFAATLRLHRYIAKNHWDVDKLVGPDPIGKVHWRITRFIRSYFPFLPAEDRYIYMQAQAYWIRSNVDLYHLTQDERYLVYVRSCADYVAKSQPEDGAWRHPPIWGRRGFISTVEGVWASLGLMAAYRQLKGPHYLNTAVRWYQYQINQIGFQNSGDGLAANYYAHSDYKVPNVTTMLIWLTAELKAHTQDDAFLKYTAPMLQFITDSQLESGELPYEVGVRPHFMCFQYNSFQFLDLANYYELSRDQKALPILEKLARFLSTGLNDHGGCRYNCFTDYPHVNYWTSALAAALRRATALNLGDYTKLSECAYLHLLAKQRSDGGFDFSERNYRVLRDRRSYPRYLSMIMQNLLYRSGTPLPPANAAVTDAIQTTLPQIN